MKNRAILVTGVVGLILVAGFFYFNSPANLSVAGKGQPLVDVNVPDLSADDKKGETAFNTYCAACHGKNAAGQDGVAPPLVHLIYEPAHHGDQAFYLAAQNGARAHHWRFGDMPPVEVVSKPEIAEIITYVRALQRANGIE